MGVFREWLESHQFGVVGGDEEMDKRSPSPQEAEAIDRLRSLGFDQLATDLDWELRQAWQGVGPVSFVKAAKAQVEASRSDFSEGEDDEAAFDEAVALLDGLIAHWSRGLKLHAEDD